MYFLYIMEKQCHIGTQEFPAFPNYVITFPN